MASRIGPLFFLVTLLSRCAAGGSGVTTTHAVPTIRVRPVGQFAIRAGAHETIARGVLRPGDVVTCDLGGHHLRIRVPNRPNGAWSVGTAAATPSGGTGQLQLRSNLDGSVTASCGR